MSTEQTFTATAAGPVWGEITSHVGTVTVTANPTLKYAVLTISTTDDKGPAAEAVRNTTIKESQYKGLNSLIVRVPEVQGAGSDLYFSDGNMVISQNFGVINGGTITGAVINSGDVTIGGGRRVVQNGRVVAGQGTVVGGTGAITIDLQVPATGNSSLRVETTSADVRSLGDLEVLEVRSLSGSVRAGGVHSLRVNTTSGATEAEAVDSTLDVSSVSGSIEVESYNGRDFRANTVSGSIRVTAGPAAHGTLEASTVSGDVTTRGTDHLRERIGTVSGRHRHHR